MKRKNQNRISKVLAIIMCLILMLVMSPTAQAASLNGTAFGGNYRTVTTATHSSTQASGSFTATHVKGAAVVDPTCAITVTAVNSVFAGIRCESASGALTCSTSVTPGEAVYGAISNSSFCGSYYYSVQDY